MGRVGLKGREGPADDLIMTAPTIPTAAVKAARTRLGGVVVLDVAGLEVLPAVYDPAAGTFTTTDAEGRTVVSDDDGTLVVLLTRPELDELVDRYGIASKAAEAATRTVRAQYRRGLL